MNPSPILEVPLPVNDMSVVQVKRLKNRIEARHDAQISTRTSPIELKRESVEVSVIEQIDMLRIKQQLGQRV